MQQAIYKKMRFTNNIIALIILVFVLFSTVGNLFVWFNVTGTFPTGRGNSGLVSLCIDVPPTFVNFTNLTANATMLFRYQLNATDSGNPIYFYANATTLPSFSMNASGFINFTPAKAEIGNHLILAWVTHNLCEHSINSKEFIFTVVLYNRMPYWINLTATSFTGTEDQLFTLNLSLNATDPEGDTVIFAKNETLANFPNFYIGTKGYILFTPKDRDVCAHTVNITISDSEGGINSSLFNFTIINVNDPPFLNSTPDQQLCEDVLYYYKMNATDDDILYVSCTTEQYHFFDNTSLFVINENTGEISFTPQKISVGTKIARIYVSDGELVDYKDVRFTIIEVNNAPVLGAIGTRTVHSNSTIYINADANDEEEGSDPNNNLTFNSTFLSGTKFFDIDPRTGEINVSTNDSLNGTYTVRVCVNDSGLSNPSANASSVCGAGSADIKSDCEDVSVTVSSANRPPVITSFVPTENLTINETDIIDYFGIIMDDPDGSSLDVYWYKNNTLVKYESNYFGSTYKWVTYLGDAGKYNITVNVTDGLLNATLTWVITVINNITIPQEPIPPVFWGGGGGGGGCFEIWTCTDWSFCQNITSPESQSLLGGLFEKAAENCNYTKIKSKQCGFQMRSCKQVTDCKITFKKPTELQPCIFTAVPTCYDGIKNCHQGSCEILVDCGGPCKECPTCSDGIKNQGEEYADCGGPCPPCPVSYPKPPKCGDKKCEIPELFSCKIDCGLFWLILLLSMLLLAVIIYLSRKEIKVIKTKSIRTARLKRERYIGNLVGTARQAIGSKNIKLAKHLYSQLNKAYKQLPHDEKKELYSKLLKIYAEIEKLEEQR